MSAEKLRVGVVDDNRSVAEIISEVLGNRDFECFDAYDGRGAIELARGRQLDLMILDFVLPDLDGLEVVRRLADIGFAIPTIMITGTPDDPPGGWLANANVKAVIRKPFTGGELRHAVSRVTGRDLP